MRSEFEKWESVNVESSGENLQKELTNFRAKLAEGNLDADTREFIQRTIADLQRRYDQQAAELDDIQLPQDYNVAFGDTRANDEIKSLLRQAKEQLFRQHNTDLAEVHSAHRAVVDQLQAAIDEHATRNTQLQQIYDAEQAAHAVTKSKLFEEQSLRVDAEQKRDNAVAQLEDAVRERDKALKEVESLKGQLDELEGIVRTLKKPAAPTGGLTFTSTLKPETEEERAARLKREEYERINRNMQKYPVEVPPLKLPELPTKPIDPPVTQQQLEDAFPGVADGQAVARDDAGGTGVSEAAAAVDGAGDAEAEPSLKERMTSLENRFNAMVDVVTTNTLMLEQLKAKGLVE